MTPGRRRRGLREGARAERRCSLASGSTESHSKEPGDSSNENPPNEALESCLRNDPSVIQLPRRVVRWGEEPPLTSIGRFRWSTGLLRGVVGEVRSPSSSLWTIWLELRGTEGCDRQDRPDEGNNRRQHSAAPGIRHEKTPVREFDFTPKTPRPAVG